MTAQPYEFACWSSCFQSWIGLIPITDGFLGDVLAFSTAAVAIALPLSIGIVVSLTSRYESSIVARRLIRAGSVGWLTALLLLNIFFIVLRRAFPYVGPPVSKAAILGVILLLFAASLVLLAKYLYMLKKYVQDSQYILDKLYEEAANTIRKASN